MKYLLEAIILFLTAFALPNWSIAQENGWKLRKDKNGIEVYTRKIENSNLIEFKATTTLDTSLQNAINIIDDVASYPMWMANLKQSKIIKRISDTERYDYYEIMVPWPFDNRDMVFYVKTLFPQNDVINMVFISNPEYIPVKGNMVRIEESKGSWLFLSVNENKTKITYQMYSDPGGYIPTWVINLLIVDGPYETLLNLQELVIPN